MLPCRRFHWRCGEARNGDGGGGEISVLVQPPLLHSPRAPVRCLLLSHGHALAPIAGSAPDGAAAAGHRNCSTYGRPVEGRPGLGRRGEHGEGRGQRQGQRHERRDHVGGIRSQWCHSLYSVPTKAEYWNLAFMSWNLQKCIVLRMKNCGTELILDQPAGEAEAISSYINYSTIGISRVLTNVTQHSPHARKNFESRRQKIRACIHHLHTNGSYGYWILAIIHTSYDIIASCTEEYIHDILWLVHDQEAKRYYLVE